MGTKLIVSLDGLKLPNLNAVVQMRSIDEVIVVNSSAEFSQINNTSQGTLTSIKNNLPNGTALSLALANETSAQLSNSFYNFVTDNINNVRDYHTLKKIHFNCNISILI